jgi:hypothetical protein
MGAAMLATAALTPTDLLQKAKQGSRKVASSITGGNKDDGYENHQKNDPRRK